jgi:hypothetical protein
MITEIKRTENRTMRHRLQMLAVLGGFALLLGSCDTDVINPGRVEDTSLNDPGGQRAMVTGAGRALSFGMNWIAYTGAAVAREIHPAGSTGSFGITPPWQNGRLDAGDSDLDDHWEQAQRARWLAEEVVRRMDASRPLTNALLVEALVWGGYANRLLGDNMCEAVFDGGPAVHDSAYFYRAEAAFTRAINVPATGAQLTAAYAGRAQVRAFLGTWVPAKWAEAVSDAAQVPTTFVFNLNYFNVGDDDQRNRIAWAVGNSPYRAHTEWNTWYYDYRQATNDPRVPITITALQGDAAIECCGRVPFYPQAKHPNSAAPIRLSSGREMRLIEAENFLRAGNLVSGMNSINAVRTAAGTTPVTALTITEAWRLLKRERGIELWLEGRRLGDLRRWSIMQTPGALDPLEVPGAASHLSRQDLCFPIPPTETETNPNLRS